MKEYTAYGYDGAVVGTYRTRMQATDAYQLSKDIEFIISPAGVVVAGTRPLFPGKKEAQVTATIEKNEETENTAEDAQTRERKRGEGPGPRGGDGGASLNRLRSWADKYGYEVVNGTKIPASEGVASSYSIDLYKDGKDLTFTGATARQAYGAALEHIRPIAQQIKEVEKAQLAAEKAEAKTAAKVAKAAQSAEAEAGPVA